MTPDQFIDALKVQVHDSAITGTQRLLAEGPAGRKPSPRLVALAEWFASVQPKDQERIQEVIRLAVHGSIFDFLCLLDGVRVVSDGAAARLELHVVESNLRTLLNPPSGEMLHDLYQSATYDEVRG